MIAQQILNGLVIGSIYVLFALGLTLVFGVNKILNLAHGAVFTCGAFVGLLCITFLKLPLVVAIVVAAVAAGSLSVLIDFIAFRPLRSRPNSEFGAIVTSIGIGMIISNVVQRLSQTQVWRYPFDTFPIVVFEFAGVRITLFQIVIMGCVVLTLIVLVYALYRTGFGQRIRAVAVDERTAGLLGVNTGAVYIQTFFISGALAGVAGVLIGIAFNSVHFLMGEPYMLRAFAIIVLGGLGSVIGTVVAGLALGVGQSLAIGYVSSELSDAIIFSVLFLALLVKPSGLFGNLHVEQRVMRA